MNEIPFSQHRKYRAAEDFYAGLFVILLLLQLLDNLYMHLFGDILTCILPLLNIFLCEYIHFIVDYYGY